MKELDVGSVLQGRYEVMAAIRAGGMGAVYRAVDRHFTGREVALKQMLDPEGRGDPETLHRRFEEEAHVLVGLSHAGIPQVYDLFSEEGSHFIAMEFIHGDSLDILLEEYLQFTGEPMPAAEAVYYALQVAEILTYLHTREPKAILHRDVKPANIVRNVTTRKAVLVDFGLARGDNRAVTATLVGTLGYAAYEQVVGKPEVRSDIYALGATLWHLLTGKVPPPFEIPLLAEVLPGVDSNLAHVVDWATRPELASRPPTATAYADTLREVKTRLDKGRKLAAASASAPLTRLIPAEEVPSPTPAAAPPPLAMAQPVAASKEIHVGLLVIGAALGAAAAIAVVVWGLHRTSAPMETPPSPPPTTTAAVATVSSPVTTETPAPTVPRSTPRPRPSPTHLIRPLAVPSPTAAQSTPQAQRTVTIVPTPVPTTPPELTNSDASSDDAVSSLAPGWQTHWLRAEDAGWGYYGPGGWMAARTGRPFGALRLSRSDDGRAQPTGLSFSVSHLPTQATFVVCVGTLCFVCHDGVCSWRELPHAPNEAKGGGLLKELDVHPAASVLQEEASFMRCDARIAEGQVHSVLKREHAPDAHLDTDLHRALDSSVLVIGVNKSSGRIQFQDVRVDF